MTDSWVYRVKVWLEKDAWNRALRTLLQTVIAAAIVAAGDALRTSESAGGIDWRAVGTAALTGAAVALVATITAYVHRSVLDPSAVPSAKPPVPPFGALSDPVVFSGVVQADAPDRSV